MKRKTRKNKAFSNFQGRCSEKKEINLNPLLSIIVNLIPLFLIVLNLRAIVGVEQNHVPPAKYNSAKKLKSKKLVNVDLNIYPQKTQVIFRDHDGGVISKKDFKSIKNQENKNMILSFIKDNKLNKIDNIGHLTINPMSDNLTFDEISQAIDVSNYKVEKKRVFKNFSIGNIL